MALDTDTRSSLHRMASAAVLLTCILLALIYGAGLLIPIVVAFIITNTLEALIGRLEGWGCPGILSVVIAIGVALIFVGGFIFVVVNQVDEFISAWPRYLERLRVLAGEALALVGDEPSKRIQTRISEINLANRISSAVGSASGVLLNFGLVMLYVGFLLAERGRIFRRVVMLGRDEAEQDNLAGVLTSVSNGIRQYLFVKTATSLLTAITSYAVLRYLDLDFAETWAVIIFFLNFIPSIGSVLGVFFPAMLALVQFDTFTPFLIIAVFLAGLQFSIGNILEPLLMGKSLNLSPFVIIVSLAFWSTIWGVAGAFLAVPITAAIVILCREVESWRWIGKLLSNNEDSQA